MQGKNAVIQLNSHELWNDKHKDLKMQFICKSETVVFFPEE